MNCENASRERRYSLFASGERNLFQRTLHEWSGLIHRSYTATRGGARPQPAGRADDAGLAATRAGGRQGDHRARPLIGDQSRSSSLVRTTQGQKEVVPPSRAFTPICRTLHRGSTFRIPSWSTYTPRFSDRWRPDIRLRSLLLSKPWRNRPRSSVQVACGRG